MEETETVGVKDFSAKILGQTVHFHLIRLQRSFFLWAGTKPSMKSLAVAMQTKYVSASTIIASCSTVINIQPALWGWAWQNACFFDTIFLGWWAPPLMLLDCHSSAVQKDKLGLLNEVSLSRTLVWLVACYAVMVSSNVSYHDEI